MIQSDRRSTKRFSALAAALALAGCELLITEGVEREWQTSSAEALIAGYSDFRGHDVDIDISWYLFSYRLPDGYDPAAVVPRLRGQISGSLPSPPGGNAPSCFEVVSESTLELQMKCPLGGGGFDEWRILVDPVSRRVTAMSGDFHSQAERTAYPALLEALRRTHAQARGRSTR